MASWCVILPLFCTSLSLSLCASFFILEKERRQGITHDEYSYRASTARTELSYDTCMIPFFILFRCSLLSHTANCLLSDTHYVRFRAICVIHSALPHSVQLHCNSSSIVLLHQYIRHGVSRPTIVVGGSVLCFWSSGDWDTLQQYSCSSAGQLYGLGATS